MRARALAVSAVLLAALAVGCSGHDGASSKTPAATPSGYSQMQQKVNSAESAAAAADRDAASNADR
ncbi:hypothetical protein [Streptomyces olivochromogenes]|uniref:hypothetical protein n=1 Tax=Streptomyces olivochromogenes TaxID=1963 RepID=UPI001F1E3B81|nr:hypothetical protein [Streptomyces olivochromogenes]MCF3131157.1 hypothetical protein [Streptomyces olivochromogenes]